VGILKRPIIILKDLFAMGVFVNIKLIIDINIYLNSITSDILKIRLKKENYYD
jgi:hypothetical protein